MPNTPNWAIPYAGPTDAPNGYAQEQGIAVAVDAALTKLNTKPRCYLRATTNQTISNGTYTALNFDAEDLDNDNMHTGAQPYVVVRTAGWWTLTGLVGFAADPDGYRFASFYINSATEIGRNEVQANQLAARGTSVFTGASLYLSAGDTIVLAVQQTSGGALATSGAGPAQCRFTAKWESA